MAGSTEGGRTLKEQVAEKAEHRKYRTFAGVFTPTLLTILGVIMYLRQGAVVGNAGLGGRGSSSGSCAASSPAPPFRSPPSPPTSGSEPAERTPSSLSPWGWRWGEASELPCTSRRPWR